MSRNFKLSCRDPIDAGHKIYAHTQFIIESGITILTGCNGAGKSTLLHMIRDELKKEKILFTFYDNTRDGGGMSRSIALENGNIGLLANLASSSEGEEISINLVEVVRRIGKYVNTLNSRDLLSQSERFEHTLSLNTSTFNSDEVWILLDGADSGLSIDQVKDLKAVLHQIVDKLQEKDKEVYIVVSANEYEMCIDEQCFEVQRLKYRQFKTYTSYKKAILRSREFKDKSIENATKKGRNHHGLRTDSRRKSKHFSRTTFPGE